MREKQRRTSRWAIVAAEMVGLVAAGEAAVAGDLTPVSETSGNSQSGSGSDSQSHRFLRLGTLGSVSWVETTRPGPFHLAGKAGIDTADYSRGAFDGVPQDLGRLSAEFGLLGSLELLDNPNGLVSSLSLIGGTDNNFADTPSNSLNDGFYETNYYAGVAAAFGPGFVAGVTYSWFGSVDNETDIDFSEQIAFAAGYTGEGPLGAWKPQLKLASVINGEGTFFGAELSPSFSLQSLPSVSFSVPLAVGAGTDDYYGKNTGTGVYGSAGLFASLPLDGIPSAYGKWTLMGGADLIVRDDTIADASRFDDAGNTVVVGSVSLDFAF